MLGYCFTKGLTQIFNLCTHLKLEYNIKYLNYIQQNFSFRIPILWNYVFFFFDMISCLIPIHPSIIKYIVYKVDSSETFEKLQYDKESNTFWNFLFITACLNLTAYTLSVFVKMCFIYDAVYFLSGIRFKWFWKKAHNIKLLFNELQACCNVFFSFVCLLMY